MSVDETSRGSAPSQRVVWPRLRFVVKSRRPFESVAYEPISETPPVGDMRLAVKDPRVVSQLTVGMEWSSTVFDVLPYLGQGVPRTTSQVTHPAPRGASP